MGQLRVGGGNRMNLNTQEIALVAIAAALWLIFLFGTNVL